MDPNAVMRRINDALEDDDEAEAREGVATLRGWLGAGGFEPDWKRYPKATAFVRRNRRSQQNPDDDAAEQDAIDERERNAGTGHQRHPGPSRKDWAELPESRRMVAVWYRRGSQEPIHTYASTVEEMSANLRRDGYDSGSMLKVTDTATHTLTHGWASADHWRAA